MGAYLKMKALKKMKALRKIALLIFNASNITDVDNVMKLVFASSILAVCSMEQLEMRLL